MLDGAREHAFDLGQIRDLRPHLLKMMRRNLPNLGARRILRPAEFDDGPDLLRAEPEISGAADDPSVRTWVSS